MKSATRTPGYDLSRPGLDHRSSDPMSRPQHPLNYTNPAVAAYAAQLGQARTPAAASPLHQQQFSSTGLRASAQSQTQYAGQYNAQSNARYSTNGQAGNVPYVSGAFYMQNEKDAIPEDIRDEFQTDEQGNVIFFSQPPARTVAKEDLLPKLSLKFRAARLRRRIEEQATKRQALDVQQEQHIAKRQKTDTVVPSGSLNKHDAVEFWQDWVADITKGTTDIYKANFGDRWEQIQQLDQKLLAANINAASGRDDDARQRAVDKEKQWLQTRQMFLNKTTYKDDYDPRF